MAGEKLGLPGEILLAEKALYRPTYLPVYRPMYLFI